MSSSPLGAYIKMGIGSSLDFSVSREELFQLKQEAIILIFQEDRGIFAAVICSKVDVSCSVWAS